METNTKLFRALLFGSVYFIEGAILTYMSGFNAIYLRSYNVPYTQIGIAGGIAMLPFILKIFIGMLSDRVNLAGLGHRKPYMVAGIIAQAVGVLLVPLVNPAQSFGLFVVLLIFISLGMSTYDTCSDGLAIDSTPEKERGFVQGVMVAGRALGAIVLASVVGLIVQRVSWAASFIFVGLVSLLPLLLVLQVREGERGPGREFSLAGFRSFLTPAMGLFLLLGILYPLVLYSANGMLGAFLKEALNASEAEVGLFVSLFGVGAVLGGLAGGPLTDRLGRRASLLAALGVTSLALIALVGSSAVAPAVAAVLLFGFAFGYYETVYMAAGMDLADPRIAASMFAIIMAAGNIGIGLGAPLAGVLVDRTGFDGMFIAFCLINLACAPLVMAVFKRRAGARPGVASGAAGG